MLSLIDDDVSSMCYWWPKVKDLGIPAPRTIMIPWTGTFKDACNLVDGKTNENIAAFITRVKDATREMGYPAFLRSDEASNKHDWERSCYIADESQIPGALANIVEFCIMVDLNIKAFAVREFLDLDWKFKSHHGMPVAAERRYFVRDGVVECWHPYWPPASIRNPTDPGWRDILGELQSPRDGEVELLTAHASKIGKALGGYWSVDFCRHGNGTWYLTDMASGDFSYHWATCQHAPAEMMNQYGDPEYLKEPYTEYTCIFKEWDGKRGCYTCNKTPNSAVCPFLDNTDASMENECPNYKKDDD